MTILLYGAYGYTGELCLRVARERGIAIVAAGRNAMRTKEVAQRHGMDHRVFGLDQPPALVEGLRDVKVVLHAAGPFAHTAKPMAEACLANKTHYLDITGEVDVFEALVQRDAEAKAAGVMLLPGAGFDVVPSDCLAAHLKGRLPDATHLVLAFQQRGGGLSHGTATTMVENLHRGSMVRREGALVVIPTGSLTREVDFGRGARHTMAIPWGDLSTAFFSTEIPNIAVYLAVKKRVRIASRAAGLMGGLLAAKPIQQFLKRRVDAQPAGPDDHARSKASVRFWGYARNAKGQDVTTTMTVPEGYTLTALTAVELAKRVAQGEVRPGYQTPSTAFGADFIMGFEGVERQDVE